MCNFFSCILKKTGEVHFTEKDSHEEVIERLGLVDNGPLGSQDFIRLEITLNHHDDCKPGVIANVDEMYVPRWFKKTMLRLPLKIGKQAHVLRMAYTQGIEAAYRELSCRRTKAIAQWGSTLTTSQMRTLERAYNTAVKKAKETFVSGLTKLPGYVPYPKRKPTKKGK